MKINEIVINPSREENIEKYTLMFSGLPLTPTPFYQNGLELDYARAADQAEYYGLFEKNQLVAILILDFDRLDLPQISLAHTNTDRRGQGLLRYLANRALDNYPVLYSDTHQTKESQHFWQMLMKFSEPRYSVMIYDVATKQLASSKGVSHDEIWNQEENPIVALVRRDTSISEQAASLRGSQIRARYGRDDWSLWYGSHNEDGYTNP